MEEQNAIEEDWRNEISESSATLKIKANEEAIFVFLTEGEKRTHADFGTSIVFEVEQDGEKKMLYVNETNYALRRQIKDLGTLAGLKVKLSRIGEKKSDTRYTIVKMEEDKEKQETPEEEEPTPETPQE